MCRIYFSPGYTPLNIQGISGAIHQQAISEAVYGNLDVECTSIFGHKLEFHVE